MDQCTCTWAVQGNVCKHCMKVLQLLTGLSEGMLARTLGARLGSTLGGVGALFASPSCPEADRPALDGNEDEQAEFANDSTLGGIEEEQAALLLESEGGESRSA
jgi:hypothetical protein